MWGGGGCVEVESEMSLGDSCHNESVYYAPYMRECARVSLSVSVRLSVCVWFFTILITFITEQLYVRQWQGLLKGGIRNAD